MSCETAGEMPVSGKTATTTVMALAKQSRKILSQRMERQKMVLQKLLVSAGLRSNLLSHGTGKRLSALGLFWFLLITFMTFPALSGAELAWKERQQLKLEVSPLDVVQSDDGKWTFILSSSAVLVYSAAEDKVVQTIPVDPGFDRLSYSNRSNRLILSSSSQKTVKIVQLEVVHRIDLAGTPILGPEKAPVTIAVFSDYQ
jgi:hypothetical protein